MTDKVQKIREEVEKRYKYWREKESNSHSIESEIRMSECQHLLLMLNSMQEEPVSEDLEKAEKHYLYSNILYDDVYVGNPTDKDCIEMFKAGAKWQKEQMLVKAIDAQCFGFRGDALFSFRLPSDNYLVGSKVKIIVIKENGI